MKNKCSCIFCLQHGFKIGVGLMTFFLNEKTRESIRHPTSDNRLTIIIHEHQKLILFKNSKMVKLKRRYLLFEVLADVQIDAKRLYLALLDQVAHLHGDYGVGAISGSLQFKVHDQDTMVVVLRISANECHFITSALPFVLALDGKRCVLHLILKASSMRTVERALIRRNMASLYAQLKNAKGKDDRQTIQKAIRSVTGPRVAHIRM